MKTTTISTAFFFVPVFALRENHKSHLPVNSFESLMLFLTIRFLFNEFTVDYGSRISENFCIIRFGIDFGAVDDNFPTYFESIRSGRYLCWVYHGLCILYGVICIREFSFILRHTFAARLQRYLRSWMDRMVCAPCAPCHLQSTLELTRQRWRQKKTTY